MECNTQKYFIYKIRYASRTNSWHHNGDIQIFNFFLIEFSYCPVTSFVDFFIFQFCFQMVWCWTLTDTLFLVLFKLSFNIPTLLFFKTSVEETVEIIQKKTWYTDLWPTFWFWNNCKIKKTAVKTITSSQTKKKQ